jgi:lipopolysaccharide transport system ATP-binding protein
VSAPAIAVEGLGKSYRLGAPTRYGSLRDSLAALVRGGRGRAHGEQIWALREVGFTIAPGEVVGVLGRNGSGKSTLLKVLARVTQPTTGEVRLRGRVGSLLEVGTGFHSELTGRENIFLGGAVIGMRRREIAARFAEIVAFAELERFIDTPVKHYSSGMYMRLAFAVAAHLDAEILLIDEVLAVGDAAFQARCLSKIGELAGHGRTVVFVSHQMSAVRRFCPRALWLEGGVVRGHGRTEEMMAGYLASLDPGGGAGTAAQIAALPADPALRLLAVALRQNGSATLQAETGASLELEIDYEVLQPTPGLRVCFLLRDLDDSAIFRSHAHGAQTGLPTAEPGRYRATCTIPPNLLAPRRYLIEATADVHNVRKCFVPGVRLAFDLHDSGVLPFAFAADGARGVQIAPLLPWRTTPLPGAADA